MIEARHIRMSTILQFTQNWKTQNYDVNSQEERLGEVLGKWYSISWSGC